MFSFTILSNTVLVGLLYPLALAIRNIPRGELTPAMFVGRRVPIAAVPAEYGRLLETPSGFTRRGLDLDALRMYLRWRGRSFSDLRREPDRYRASIPVDPNDPGDGAIRDDPAVDDDLRSTETVEDDPWGAEAFLSEYSAYGTTPQELREGLAVVSDPSRETVWITPGIPFIVPMFVGLVVALTFGDVMFALFSLLGMA